MDTCKKIHLFVLLIIWLFVADNLNGDHATGIGFFDDKIKMLKEALAESRQTVDDAKKWIAVVKQYSEPTELTAELLNNMIEKIVIHEAIKHDGGFREQKIEIYYRFVGKID